MSKVVWDRLAAPFPPSAIHWRIGRKAKGGSGQALVLPYIQARDVMDRLDQVVGPENWQTHYPHASDKVICQLSVRIDGEWIAKCDGAGDTSIEADKGAISDALKRAGVLFGIARYLYRLDSVWARVDSRGQIADEEKNKLESVLREAAWDVNPVSGDRIDSDGNVLMDRKDVVEMHDKCVIRLQELELLDKEDSFDPIIVLRDCLESYPEYKGIRTEQLSILPKHVGDALSKAISSWKPKEEQAPDF